MDNKGYVMGGMAFLLIIPALILANILVSTIATDKTQITPVKSDKLYQLSEDLESDIPKFTLQALNETSDMVSKTGEPVINSRMIIKNIIQTKLDRTYGEYQSQTGIKVHCTIDSVDNSNDPYELCINSSWYATLNDSYMAKNLSQEVKFACSDISDSPWGPYKIKDPLPFIKTKKYGDIKIEGDKIFYGNVLSNYLKSKGITNYEVYENACSPLYIKPCPYEPYPSHGHSKLFSILKNCIDNGYYHVSADGSCIFCRLDGKSVCSHVGLETFVVPNPQLHFDTAPCSVDHVIFGDSPDDIYHGKLMDLNFNNSCLYLDNGHRDKYGLPNQQK